MADSGCGPRPERCVEPARLEKFIIRHPRVFLSVVLSLCFCIAVACLPGESGDSLESPFLFVCVLLPFVVCSSVVYSRCNLLAEPLEERLKAGLRKVLFCLQAALLAVTVVPFVLLACVRSYAFADLTFVRSSATFRPGGPPELEKARWELQEDTWNREQERWPEALRSSVILYCVLPDIFLGPCLAAALLVVTKRAYQPGRFAAPDVLYYSSLPLVCFGRSRYPGSFRSSIVRGKSR